MCSFSHCIESDSQEWIGIGIRIGIRICECKKVINTKKIGMVTSLHRNSLIDDRRTFRPSADREYGVSPDPLN